MITPEFNTNLDNPPEPKPERSFNTGERPQKPGTLDLISRVCAVIIMIGLTALAASLIIAGITAFWRFIL